MTAVHAIDLRSDTVTRPGPAMRRAMAEASVGDDVFGEDPTVNALEREVAVILGHEAAIFVPSGTMANQIAVQLHTQPGDSVLCEEEAHVFLHEAGASAALAGVQFDFVPLAERLSDVSIRRTVRPDELHAAATRLLVVENTHNHGRGRALRVVETRRIIGFARSFGLRVHCDGARLWNASAATGDLERDLTSGFDTVAVAFSKGLGAPVGSALAGSTTTVERARRLRKRLGGGMRQAGILAAGALYALRHHRERLVDDHRRAERLAAGIAALAAKGRPLRVEMPEPATNMVYFHLEDGDADDLSARLARDGLLVIHLGHGWIRAVTHLDVDDDGIERALAILDRVF